MLGPAASGLNRYCADGKRLAPPAGLAARCHALLHDL